MSNIQESLHNWIPVKLLHEKDGMRCKWLHTGGVLFTDPFFVETIHRCLSLPGTRVSPYCVSNPEVIAEWACHVDAATPTAFIFHVSRCGSTLAGQCLAADPENIVLSEVPLFDQLLMLPYGGIIVPDLYKIVAGAITFYGAKRTGLERRLFIKTDSWHLALLPQLRAMYPGVPFIILYRDPGEVLHSNKRKKGTQGIPGLLPSALFGFGPGSQELTHPDDYMPAVLEQFFLFIADAARNDQQTLLLNYSQGLEAITEQLYDFTGMPLEGAQKSRIAARSGFHSKYPAEKFVEKNTAPVRHPRMDALNNLYHELEQIRLGGQERAGRRS